MIEHLPEPLRDLTGWLSRYAWWFLAVSLLMFVISLVVIRFFLINIPADYFVHRESYVGNLSAQQRLSRVGMLALKNFLGFMLVVLGLVTSIPGVVGQGALTLLIGLALMNFPGKKKLMRVVVGNSAVSGAINSIRIKAGKPPIIVEDQT